MRSERHHDPARWLSRHRLLSPCPDRRIPSNIESGEPVAEPGLDPTWCIVPALRRILVPSYTASLERDVTGTPVTLWRCVNCGDCVDHDILANRGKGSGSARVRVRPSAGPQYIGRPQEWEQA